MKSNLPTLLLAIGLLAAACNMTSDAQPDGYVRCTVDGVKWDADVLHTVEFDSDKGDFSLFGSTATPQTVLSIDVQDVFGPGTFDLSDPSHDGNFKELTRTFRTYTDLQGEIVITSMTSVRAKGTFWFDARDISDQTTTVKVRNGEFNVEYF